MDDQIILDKGTIDQARESVRPSGVHGGDLFKEVGKLTRQLHDALAGLSHGRLSDLAAREMPDAKARLHRVIDMTEDAAHRTVAAVERTIPVCQALGDGAAALRRKWAGFAHGGSVDGLREIAVETGEFLAVTANEAGTVKAGLDEILVAQEYQDLTGQTIRRVITLVQEVENSLVDMIRSSGSPMYSEETAPVNRKPQSVNNQDEVDELLSSLGF